MANRKIDPSVRVLEFFQTQALPLAEQALATAKHVVQQRQAAESATTAVPPKPKAKRRKKPATPPVPGTPASLRPTRVRGVAAASSDEADS